LIEPNSVHAVREAAILLVEDDRYVACMFGLGLHAAGLDVVLAGDGGSAVGLASRTYFDLVLLDVHLPRMDGLEALSLLRSQPSTRDLPVVMFTNSEDDGTRRRADALGITDWIVKSRITPGELARLVRTWLGRRRTPFHKSTEVTEI
jgi:CheY-like chemotaxis protein